MLTGSLVADAEFNSLVIFSVVPPEIERDLGLTLGFPISPSRSLRSLSPLELRLPYFHGNITVFQACNVPLCLY